MRANARNHDSELFALPKLLNVRSDVFWNTLHSFKQCRFVDLSDCAARKLLKLVGELANEVDELANEAC